MSEAGKKYALKELALIIEQFCLTMERECSQDSYDLDDCYLDCPLNRKTMLGGV